MNYMTNIAWMLGVKEEERFKLRKQNEKECMKGLYKINVYGLNWSNDGGRWKQTPVTLAMILAGGLEIIKQPWTPDFGKEYWGFSDYNIDVKQHCWTNNPLDNMRLRLGFVYETEAEARRNLAKWENFYSSTDRIEWDK